ncbi:MAG: hypothetical protein SPL94_08915, partial [Oribacterium sp.]|nr:hypothetical protein [Oribacterium sp.]
RPNSGKILEGIFPSMGLKNRALWAPIFYPARRVWLAKTFGFMFVRVPLQRALHEKTTAAFGGSPIFILESLTFLEAMACAEILCYSRAETKIFFS